MSDLPRDPQTPANGTDDPEPDELLGAVEDGEPAEDEPEPESAESEAIGADPQPRQHGPRGASQREQILRLEESNRALERRIEELSRNRQPAGDARAAAEQEAQFYRGLEERFGLPQDATRELVGALRNEFRSGLMQAELRGFDRSDVAEFNQLRGSSKAAERLAPQVEQILSSLRGRGIYDFGRLDIYDFLSGRDQRLRGQREQPRQQRQANNRIAAQAVRANGAAASDVQRGRQQQTQDEADEAVLRSITMRDIQ